MDRAIRLGIATTDPLLLQAMAETLRRLDGELEIASDGAEASRMLASPRWDAFVIDCRLPQMPLTGVTPLPPSLHDTLLLLEPNQDTVERQPLRHIIPFQREDIPALSDRIGRLRMRGALASERLLGVSPQVAQLRDELRRLARFEDVPVLLLGETGTGKEHVARVLHEMTFGPERPFLAIHCATLGTASCNRALEDDTELTAWLGPGAAALVQRPAGGTLFLDHVQDMPDAAQAALARWIAARAFEGSSGGPRLRVVTTMRLPYPGEPIAPLRPELSFPLSAYLHVLPALRERREDILPLARHLLTSFAERYRLGELRFAEGCEGVLTRHEWLGNVRELKCVVERAAIEASHGLVTPDLLDTALQGRACAPPMAGGATPSVSPSALSTSAPPSSDDSMIPPLVAARLKDVERTVIADAFRRNGENLSRTARELGLARSTLRLRLKRYGLVSADKS